MRVQKGNVQYTIADSMKNQYLEMGFAVIDEDGEIIETKAIDDEKALRMENEALKSEVEKLRSENEKLKAKKAAEPKE